MTTTTGTDVACRCCGVATDERRVRLPAFNEDLGRLAGEYEAGTCGDCAGLRPDEPGAAVRAALRLLGRDEADADVAAEAFALAGLDVAGLLFDTGRGRKPPQRKAWAHVTKEDRARLKRAYVRVLDVKVHGATDAPERGTPPPAGPPACLACGVGRAERWYGEFTVTGRKFTGGGARGVTGCVCPACLPALKEAGAFGPGFLERAVMAAKGLAYTPGMDLPGLRAWSAMGLPPSEVGWDWVNLKEPPPPEPDPVLVLMEQVAALTARVADLEARLP